MGIYFKCVLTSERYNRSFIVKLHNICDWLRKSGEGWETHVVRKVTKMAKMLNVFDGG